MLIIVIYRSLEKKESIWYILEMCLIDCKYNFLIYFFISTYLLASLDMCFLIPDVINQDESCK